MNCTCTFRACRLLGGALMVGVLALLAGCGSKGTLSGKVTYQGKALPTGTRIVFLHEATDRSFSTEVKGEDGSYVMDGLPVGKFLIGVQPVGTANVGGGGAGQLPSKGNIAGVKEKSTVGPSTGSPDVIAPPPGFEGAFNPQKGGGNTPSLLPRDLQDPRTSNKSIEVKGGKQPFDIAL